MNFFEQPASRQWSTLKYRGKPFAEVWFKPEGEACALTFRIPQESFQTPGLASLLTMGNLLKAIGIACEAVDSWRTEGVTESIGLESSPEFNHPLPSPPPPLPHLLLQVTMKPPHPVAATSPTEVPEIPVDPATIISGSCDAATVPTEVPEIPLEQWHDLQARWNGLLLLEAKIDSLRHSVDGSRTELDNLSKRPLTPEEKVNALSSDVSQLTKAKSRAHHGLPRARDFVQRATWAMATPERKELGEVFEDKNRTNILIDRLDHLSHQLDTMLKERQILSAQGMTVSQECKNMTQEIRQALSTLQSNAAARARQKKESMRGKGK